MTVKELIKILQNLDQKSNVILQKDSEGNGYSPLCGAEPAIYVADSGKVYRIERTAEDNCMEIDEWEKLKNSKENKCVVLWPIN